MKFTKFLAATMAAVTIASCSEQVTDLGGNTQPGDAVLSFKVGTSGGTTYATETQETAVNSLTAFLKYKNGSNVDAVMQVATTTAGVSATLPDGTFTPGAAKLYLIANKAVTAATEADILALTDNKVIYSNNAGALEIDATGMTATRELNIDLQAGTVNTGMIAGGGAVTGEVTLKRIAARVYASSTTATATDIAGYKVDFAGTTSQANLFSYAGSGTGTAPATYTITGVATGQYPQANPTEAVGYVYPSTTDVTITVTHPADAKITREIKFKPVANKNYKLLITPSSGTTLNFTVKLAEYEDENLDEADFGVTTKQAFVDALTVPAGVTAAGETITIDSYADFSTGTDIDLADLGYGIGIAFGSIDKIEVASPVTRAIDASNYLKVTTSGKKMTLKTVPNTSGNDISVKVIVTGTGDSYEDPGKTIKTSFDVVLSSVPANLLEAMDEATVDMKGVKWVMFGTSSDLKQDLQRALDIKNAGGFTLATLQNVSNKALFLNSKAITATASCPKGYRVPTMNDFYALLGEHRPEAGAGTSGKWLATQGTTKTFASGVVGKAEVLSPADAYAVYSYTDGGKTLWMTGNKGYITSTSPDGIIAAIPANSAAVIRFAPWQDGIAYNTILKTDVTSSLSDLRCVVDENYKGLN